MNVSFPVKRFYLKYIYKITKNKELSTHAQASRLDLILVPTRIEFVSGIMGNNQKHEIMKTVKQKTIGGVVVHAAIHYSD